MIHIGLRGTTFKYLFDSPPAGNRTRTGNRSRTGASPVPTIYVDDACQSRLVYCRGVPLRAPSGWFSHEMFPAFYLNNIVTISAGRMPMCRGRPSPFISPDCEAVDAPASLVRWVGASGCPIGSSFKFVTKAWVQASPGWMVACTLWLRGL